MDNFIDKLAQKFTAQEIIKANASAEAKELQRTREQVQQYEAYLQEMKQVNESTKKALSQFEQTLTLGVEKINNTQVPTEDIHSLIEESLKKIHSVQETAKQEQSVLEERLAEQIRELQSQLLEQMEVQRAQAAAMAGEDAFSQAQLEVLKEQSAEQIAAVKEQLDEQKEQLVDFVHKENVKVYRNVQAVVVDELNKQTESLSKQLDRVIHENKSIMSVAVTSLIFTILSTGALVYFILLSLGIF